MELTPSQKAGLEADFQTALSVERLAQNAHVPGNPRFIQTRRQDGNTQGSVLTWTDEYDGPSGIGWIFYGEAVVSGTTYQRRVDSGAESHWTSDWLDIT